MLDELATWVGYGFLSVLISIGFVNLASWMWNRKVNEIEQRRYKSGR